MTDEDYTEEMILEDKETGQPDHGALFFIVRNMVDVQRRETVQEVFDQLLQRAVMEDGLPVSQSHRNR